ncbi:MAG: nucleotide exchange factor GrpE [Candidatus Magnetominusculus sp. LBB02]|nr:nucleotide exchange factor GrpE [Candidatus Magnetominusculus sp. LBB02]
MKDKKTDITDGDAATGSSPDVGLVFELKPDELERLKQENSELNDKYKRLYAEFDNYRKRVQKEKDEIYKYGSETLITSLLSVIDNLEAALSHVVPGLDDGLAKGVDMTLKELKKILASNGLADVEAKGKSFDPAFHHAMTEIERGDLDDKTVVEEFRKGYMFKDRLIRAALVSVSKKAAAPVTEQNNDTMEADNG